MNTNFPHTERVMPVPSVEPTAPLVPSPVDHEKIKVSIAPDNQWAEEGTYCNTLPSAPRNQLAQDPVNINKGCNVMKTPTYNPKKCYVSLENSQNIPALFCGGAGGSGNSNFVRGNQFSNSLCGLSYKDKSRNTEMSIGDNQMRLNTDNSIPVNEYSPEAQRPVQQKMENVVFKDNHYVVNNSPYYPYPSFKNRLNREYRTYPHSKQYNSQGKPLYTSSSNVIEGFGAPFEGGGKRCNANSLWSAVILIVLVIIALLMTKK